MTPWIHIAAGLVIAIGLVLIWAPRRRLPREVVNARRDAEILARYHRRSWERLLHDALNSGWRGE